MAKDLQHGGQVVVRWWSGGLREEGLNSAVGKGEIL